MTIMEKLVERGALPDVAQLRREVAEVVKTTPVIDIHTHLLAPEFGEMSLFGIDELLTYHYLIVETLRSRNITAEQFWDMNMSEQADLVWKTLFVENTPLSEATRGVVTVLSALGLDTGAPDLSEARAFFRSRSLAEHVNVVLDLACVSDVVMTNDPFSTQEVKVWETCTDIDKRFHATLRMDRLVNDWEHTVPRLNQLGYQVEARGSAKSAAEVRRFLGKWIATMRPVCMAVSLPAEFKFPDNDSRDWVLREVALPAAQEHGLALAVMVGVRRGVNPALRVAGDGAGRADVTSLERMCAEYPDVRFLATFLSRENQHELCVAARKFSNLMPFGCWWFLNNPSIITEITRERLELLGTSFIPQHSDARILEQLIYKWGHSRDVIAETLCESYERLLQSGRAVTRQEIERDVTRMLRGNFLEWIGGLPTRPSTGPAALTAEKVRQPEEPDVVTTY
ncbi:MAG: hypothetical protein ND895_24535 [Pyrinomonadaceae bacterium]|nr:hypothetical protein [Pyrinomonadaceae bacterium]